jgi:mandelamide amidase
MRRGDITAERYATALLARCEALKALNAFITLDRDKVLEAARKADQRRAAGDNLGALHGLPIPIKDSINTKDLPTTSATAALRNFTPKSDAEVVQTLYQQGALPLGKTNLHEMSFWWTSANSAFGPVHNPYDPKRVPGGSSGGTAVAIATRMAPVGLAEDTNGSIRVPAAFCGIVGFRPTTLRWPQAGVMPLTPAYDTVGPHSRSVADAILLDSVVTGSSPPAQPANLTGIRIGISRSYFFAGLDSEVEKVSADVLKKLQDAGVELVEADIPNLAELAEKGNYPIIHQESVPNINAYLERYDAPATLDMILAQATPEMRQAMEWFIIPGGKYRAPYDAYVAARNTYRPALQNTFRRYFRENNLAAIVFPATMCAATPMEDVWEVEVNGQKVPSYIAWARNITPGSCAGIPGLVLPGGLTGGGLPVGIEFDGPVGKDRELLALGLALEKILGPIQPPPV